MFHVEQCGCSAGRAQRPVLSAAFNVSEEEDERSLVSRREMQGLRAANVGLLGLFFRYQREHAARGFTGCRRSAPGISRCCHIHGADSCRTQGQPQ